MQIRGKVYIQGSQSIITLTTDTTDLSRDKAVFFWENALNVLCLKVSLDKGFGGRGSCSV